MLAFESDSPIVNILNPAGIVIAVAAVAVPDATVNVIPVPAAVTTEFVDSLRTQFCCHESAPLLGHAPVVAVVEATEGRVIVTVPIDTGTKNAATLQNCAGVNVVEVVMTNGAPSP